MAFNKNLEWINERKTFIYLVLSIIGIALIFYNEKMDIKATIGDIGLALFITSLISLIFYFLPGVFENKLIELANSVGLRGFYKSRSAFKNKYNDYNKILEQANNSIIAVGVTLNNFLKESDIRDKIITLVENRGMHISLLLMDVNSKFFEQRGLEQDNLEELKQRLNTSYKLIKELKDKLRDKNKEDYIEVKKYDKMPLHSMFIIDHSNILVMPYQYGTKEGAWLELNSNEDTYFEQFYKSYARLSKVSEILDLS